MSVSRETRLAFFAELLLRWNPRVNLIARGDETRLWTRHINDSLQLADLIPLDVDTAIDLGTGAGFPGLILAIATGIHFILIESDHRKVAFLNEAIRVTGASATVVPQRIEVATLPQVPLVTARAFAPLPELLAVAEPLLLPVSLCLFPKGRHCQSELTAAERHWILDVEKIPSTVDPQGCILRITRMQRKQSG